MTARGRETPLFYSALHSVTNNVRPLRCLTRARQAGSGRQVRVTVRPVVVT